MKRITTTLMILMMAAAALSCGGGDDNSNLTGPVLDISGLTSIKIDQLKFTDTTETNQDKELMAAVYLRCSETGKYMACAGQEQGLDVVKRSGGSYGMLNAQLVAVEEAEGNCMDIEVVFVKKLSNDCPATVNPNDDIVGVSSPASLDDTGEGSLLEDQVSSEDGSNWVRLIAGDIEPLTDLEPSATVEDTVLSLDQLYFTTPEIYGKEATFKLIVKDVADSANLLCMATFSEANGIMKENIIYGGLGIQLLDQNNEPCKLTDDNKFTKVSIALTIITDGDDTVETLKTDPEEEITLASIVNTDGLRERFIDDKGFVRFTPLSGI